MDVKQKTFGSVFYVDNMEAFSDDLANNIADKVIKIARDKFNFQQYYYPLKDQWLDIQQVCRTLNISKRGFQNYRDSGLIPYSKIGGKIYVKASDLQQVLEDHKIPARKTR